MITRAVCEGWLRGAIDSCDPARLVRSALHRAPADAAVGIAIGKAAMGMARGAGPIARGVVVAPVDDGRGVPDGWVVMLASAAEPDARSLAAGDAVIDMIASARRTEPVLALISGGAASLCERLEPGVTLDQLRAELRELAARAASAEERAVHRRARSAIHGGKLAHLSEAPITTLAISHLVGDDVNAIGGGPTVADRPDGRAEVIARLDTLAWAVDSEIEAGEIGGPHVPTVFQAPMTGEIARVADEIVGSLSWACGVEWGRPTVRLPPDHGVGGRAQQLALELAKRFRGRDQAEALVVASDGLDGPPPPDRPTPAGAYVDGTTWDAIRAAGLDPQRALDRCDAGTALHAVGALVVTGPTGIDHAELAIFR